MHAFPSQLRAQLTPTGLTLTSTVNSEKQNEILVTKKFTQSFSSVNQLDTAFQEARREAEVYYDRYTESDKALTAARISIDQLTTEFQQLRVSFQDLNTTHKSHEKFS